MRFSSAAAPGRRWCHRDEIQEVANIRQVRPASGAQTRPQGGGEIKRHPDRGQPP